MGFTKKDFYKLHLQFAGACEFKPTSYKGFKLRIARGWGVVELLATPSKSKIISKNWASFAYILEDMPADVLDVLIKELNRIRDAGFDQSNGIGNTIAKRQEITKGVNEKNKQISEKNKELAIKVNDCETIIERQKRTLEKTQDTIEALEKQNNALRKIIFIYSFCLGLGGILATILILKYCI